MSHPGVGVMIGMLGGNEETVKAVKESVGKTIKTIVLSDDELSIAFEEGKILKMKDDGQSCCESRYMRTDDSLPEFVGSKILDFELRSAPNVETEYDEHEVQFLAVKTDRGTITFSNHNEHNGYYGGFWITARLIENTPIEEFR